MPTVSTRHQGDMLFEVQAGSHTLLSDIPPRAGGKDRGPTGTELLASALSACVAAMVAYQGQRIGADTSGMSVDVSYEWAVNPLRLANLKVSIHLPNCRDEEQRQAILEAARHCPVHNTITSVDAVEMALAE